MKALLGKELSRKIQTIFDEIEKCFFLLYQYIYTVKVPSLEIICFSMSGSNIKEIKKDKIK